MTSFLDIFATLVTIAGTVGGLLVALGQITAGTRLRRQATHWREEMEAASLAHDQAVYQSLHREAAARVLALQAIPGRHLLFPSFYLVVAVATSWQTGVALGRVPSNEMTWARAMDVAGNLPSVLLSVLFVLFGIVGWANVILGRRLLVQTYLDGRDLYFRVVDPLSEEKPANRALGWKGMLMLLLSSAGLWCLLLTLGARFSMPPISQGGAVPSWIYYPLIPAAASTVLWSVPLRRLSHYALEPWKHPRPLTTEAVHEAAKDTRTKAPDPN